MALALIYAEFCVYADVHKFEVTLAVNYTPNKQPSVENL
jgi:hypothetical protein